MPRPVLLGLLLITTAAALPTTHPPALKGLAEADLAVNLRQPPLNLRFSAGQQMRLAYSKCAKGPYSGNMLDVCYDRVDGKIVMVNATVFGRDAASGREFLGYLASMPIQGVSPAAVRAWVEKAYPQVREGRPAEQVFGSIKFVLGGNNRGAMFLQVFHKDYTAWALKRLE